MVVVVAAATIGVHCGGEATGGGGCGGGSQHRRRAVSARDAPSARSQQHLDLGGHHCFSIASRLRGVSKQGKSDGSV